MFDRKSWRHVSKIFVLRIVISVYTGYKSYKLLLVTRNHITLQTMDLLNRNNYLNLFTICIRND